MSALSSTLRFGTDDPLVMETLRKRARRISEPFAPRSPSQNPNVRPMRRPSPEPLIDRFPGTGSGRTVRQELTEEGLNPAQIDVALRESRSVRDQLRSSLLERERRLRGFGRTRVRLPG